MNTSDLNDVSVAVAAAQRLVARSPLPAVTPTLVETTALRLRSL